LLETMLRELGVPYLGAIPSARIYSRCLEQGLTVFDFPSAVARGQTPHWAGVIAWLETILAKVRAHPGSPGVAAGRAVATGVQPRPVVQTSRPSLAAALLRNIPRFLVR